MDRLMSALKNNLHLEMTPFQQQPDRKFVLEVGAPGLLDTLNFNDNVRIELELPDTAVEIEVKATGLDFKDVMMATGRIAVEILGAECSGVIRSVGQDVQDLAIGAAYPATVSAPLPMSCGRTPRRSRRSRVTCCSSWAAALPVTFCTAFYAIAHVARVTSGQSVLIHAASGGRGPGAHQAMRDARHADLPRGRHAREEAAGGGPLWHPLGADSDESRCELRAGAQAHEGRSRR